MTTATIATLPADDLDLLAFVLDGWVNGRTPELTHEQWCRAEVLFEVLEEQEEQ